MYKIAVLVSGGGSNFLAVAKAIKSGYIKNAAISCVISDNPNAKALDKASQFEIDSHIVDKKVYKKELSDKILEILDSMGGVDLIVLGGFLSILGGEILEKYKNKIINIHPSLIPSFCGDGMYGLKVHKAAIDYGVKVTGCTVHFVDSGTDTGAILLQQSVDVTTDDPLKLQSDVLLEEHKTIVKAVKLLSENRVKVDGRKVCII